MPKWKCLCCGDISFGWKGFIEWVEGKELSVCPHCEAMACVMLTIE